MRTGYTHLLLPLLPPLPSPADLCTPSMLKNYFEGGKGYIPTLFSNPLTLYPSFTPPFPIPLLHIPLHSSPIPPSPFPYPFPFSTAPCATLNIRGNFEGGNGCSPLFITPPFNTPLSRLPLCATTPLPSCLHLSSLSLPHNPMCHP